MIEWLKDRHTRYIFPDRFLLPPATEPRIKLADANP
jgi:hypothetical protein